MADSKKLYTSFLGTGWSFPPTFVRGINTVKMLSDVEDINSSLQILLDTTVGERVMEPTYGCNLYQLLFEPLNATTRTQFKNMIERAVLNFEPRIRLEDVKFSVNQLEGRIECKLDYSVISTNTRYNFVFPFYINEATALKG